MVIKSESGQDLSIIQSLKQRLRSRGDSVDRLHAFYIPGRFEFLGKHTDYAGGRTLTCAIDRGFHFVACPRKDRFVRVIGNGSNSDLSFELHQKVTPASGHWSNYPMTVARRIARNFPGDLIGADIAFSSDLPSAAGLSSSSAMIIAFFLVLSSVNHLHQRNEYQQNIHSPLDLAGYLATVENGETFGALRGDRGVGTFGGSEDHTAILTAVPGHLSQYRFCPARLERTVRLPADHSLVIGVSGVIAEKTGSAQAAYNNASLAARAVLEQWNNHSGRNDATLAAAIDFDAAGVRAAVRDESLINRVDHFIAESTQIVPAAADALAAGCLDELGLLADRSQELAEKLLKNQVPETVFLAKAARQLKAVAASSFGAGFGGSVWALVHTDRAKDFIEEWRSRYQCHFAQTESANFLIAAAGEPAREI